MEDVTTQVKNQFYRRTWIQTIVPTALSSKSKCWVVFLDEVGLGKQISAQLKGAAHKVVEVKPGTKFAKLGKYEYAIRPNLRSDYDALIGDLQRKGNTPDNILHLWSVVSESSERTTEEILDAGFYSLFHLVKAVAEKTVVWRRYFSDFQSVAVCLRRKNHFPRSGNYAWTRESYRKGTPRNNLPEHRLRSGRPRHVLCGGPDPCGTLRIFGRQGYRVSRESQMDRAL